MNDRTIERMLLAGIIIAGTMSIAHHARAETKVVAKSDVTIRSITLPYRPTVNTIYMRSAPQDAKPAPRNNCPSQSNFEIASGRDRGACVGMW